MLEVFAFLLSLGNTIKNVFNELKSSEQKNLPKRYTKSTFSFRL